MKSTCYIQNDICAQKNLSFSVSVQGLVNYWPFSGHTCDVAGGAHMIKTQSFSYTADRQGISNSSAELFSWIFASS